MIKIALIDDEKTERDILRKCYEKLREELSEHLRICEFESGDAFLGQFDGSFDLICMDIDMAGTDGIQAARQVRQKDENVIIIFVTNMAQMAICGYEVRALDFILKPVNYYAFALKMRNVFNIIRSAKSRTIMITTASGLQGISTDDLYYVEVERHYLFFHTKKGDFRQKASLKGSWRMIHLSGATIHIWSI